LQHDTTKGNRVSSRLSRERRVYISRGREASSTNGIRSGNRNTSGSDCKGYDNFFMDIHQQDCLMHFRFLLQHDSDGSTMIKVSWVVSCLDQLRTLGVGLWNTRHREMIQAIPQLVVKRMRRRV